MTGKSAMVVASLCLLASACRADDDVSITHRGDVLRIEIGGKLFSEYHFKNVPRPFFYPLLGPDEEPMTRHWPMESPDGEEHDHPHHRSLWYAHGSVNGMDFWSEEKNFCKIVHQKFVDVRSGKDSGVIVSSNNWVARDGSVACMDERTFRVYSHADGGRMFDFEITLYAPPDKPVVFGDTKEGTMALRMAESMRLSHKKGPGDGHIVLSTGVRDNDAWGKRADWCDYYGPVDGRTAGIAIFDHPDNPRHPTWWHVRDYGLFAANPFGVHDFEKKPAGAGSLTLSSGQSLTFRYRFYIHRGNDQQARVADHYRDYASKPSK